MSEGLSMRKGAMEGMGRLNVWLTLEAKGSAAMTKVEEIFDESEASLGGPRPRRRC